MNLSTRWVYASACAAAIVLGLASRRFSAQWGQWVVAYAGDTLWAAMVLFGLAWMLPKLHIKQLGLLALGLCFAVEFSQLAHAPWLDALRRTPVGGMLLGRTFLWSDMMCYVVGVGLGMVAKHTLDSLFPPPKPPAPKPAG
jgi:hypothetical protein